MTRKMSFPIVLVFLAAFGAVAGTGLAVDTHDTRFLSSPAISQSEIAFVYANDLWAADPDGKNPRRLTTQSGVVSAPVFSPDGRWLAFSGQYDGNLDVFLMPAGGGVPKRLTWHPAPDFVQAFSADGTFIFFTSTRGTRNRSEMRLFRVPVGGGFPEEYKIPAIVRAAFSPDGAYIAYNPLPEAFTQWKHYRGGRVSEVWILKLSDYSIEKIPQPEGRSNDVQPMWLGETLYFLSDRAGEFNLFSYDTKTKAVRQLTDFADFPILNASLGAGRIIFERAGYLNVYDPARATTGKLTIGLAADLLEIRERYVKGAQWIRGSSISPSGARAVFEFRGEVVTVPAEKGDPRNITNTPGANERAPVWSPDGKSIAYFGDASGEYLLYVRSQDGIGEPRAYKLDGAGFYSSPVWSPDSLKIAYTDNSLSLFWIDLRTGASKKIGSEYYYSPIRARNPGSWSPDSKWIACTLDTRASFGRVYAYSLDQDKSFPVTDGLSDAGEPVFDASGKYLYFFASTDAGPVKNWFDMSNEDMRMTNAIYVAVLRRDLPSPLAKESDEEKPAAAEEKEKKETKAPAGTKASASDRSTTGEAKSEAKTPEPFGIDFDGLDHRILALPVSQALHWNLQAGDEGQVYFQEELRQAAEGPSGSRAAAVHRFDMKTRKDEVVIAEVDGYLLSADRKKIGYGLKDSYWIIPASGKPEPGKGRLNIEAVEVKIDPRDEWNQIFNEVWRINRDYFYDPGMHGANWAAMKGKYAAFLPDLSCRTDLNRVIQWLCSELAVGHSYGGGGDQPFPPKRLAVGLLGADYAIENDRYRFKKVFGGLNWNPELRSPLTEPGVDVKAGEYLMAVGGKDLRPPANLYSLFEETAGKIVEITVGPNPDGRESRTVKVVPVADEYPLRNRDWVEGNLKKVDQATGGRVAYVYVPNTSTLGHTYFKRYFFPQTDKDAIIVDERYNGGGSVADYYIDILRRPFIAMWATRYGHDYRTPNAMIPGPKVMLINELAGSGGDLLPWMFRKFGLGKLIGKRTWGGLVGILGFPVLMDGGMVTAPNLAIWTEDGWVVENEGVPPDIEVEQWPAQVAAGHDPQLEKAIEVVMEELKANPPKKPARPPFPVRVK